MEKIKIYLSGLALLLALALLGIVGFIGIGLITLTVFVIFIIVFALVAIVALLFTPYYYAKTFKVKSRDFRIKKIKKKERL
jgi:membrane protein implicated in regulation of membrane protease activity